MNTDNRNFFYYEIYTYIKTFFFTMNACMCVCVHVYAFVYVSIYIYVPYLCGGVSWFNG